MNFDEIINRYGTHSAKWDGMAAFSGITAADAIPMWVADMDFRPPACVQRALEQAVQHRVYGYFGDDSAARDAIVWWMKARHGWEVQPEWISTTHGLVNGVALCLAAFTKPGDAVILTTPVYHAFARVIRAQGREVVECKLRLVDGRYEMDFASWQGALSGREKVFLLCSPHNPGGRVWRPDELRGVADFCRAKDLMLWSDEIHHDLVMPGQHHTPMPLAAPEIADRLVMLTATTKTFNIAGAHLGNVVIANPELRAKFQAVMMAYGISPNSLGMAMATAAYSQEGAVWVDALCDYLRGNAQVVKQGLSAIDGVKVMELEGTYLAWADFRGTGLSDAEILRRFGEGARVAVNPGAGFGAGGEGFMRLNFATPRSVVAEAVERIRSAFS